MPTILNEDANREASKRAQSAAFKQFALAAPPSDSRELELWLQHAAGFILFESVRAAGLATLEPNAGQEVRDAVQLALDGMMYALMMHIDGVTSGPKGEEGSIGLTVGVELVKDDEVAARVDLRDGDGMCMGFHFWVDGDYGETPIVKPE